MLARVTNLGYRKVFPTCRGDVLIPRWQSIEIEDRELLKELKDFEYIEIDVLQADPLVDYSKFSINQLRRIATQAGIAETFQMRKSELIKKLEEKNATI